jgi:Ankyrin repeats (3 copies)
MNMTKMQISDCAVGGDSITATEVSRGWRQTWRQAKRLRIEQRRLVRAVRKNLLLEVQVLLHHGVVPNAFAAEDPLAIAIARGFDEIVDVLLAAGARSWRAMLVAAVANKPAILLRMIEAWDRPPLSHALYWAVRAGALEASKLLLASGSKDTRAAMLVAARTGNIDLIQLLLAHGASPNGEVLRACAYGSNRDRGLTNLQLLLASGGDVDVALRGFPSQHISYAALGNMGEELGLCTLLAHLPTNDPNYAKAKHWIANMTIIANTYPPARNSRDRSDANRFDDALVFVHRELFRCAALFGLDHSPNPEVTALML